MDPETFAFTLTTTPEGGGYVGIATATDPDTLVVVHCHATPIFPTTDEALAAVELWSSRQQLRVITEEEASGTTSTTPRVPPPPPILPP